MPKTQTGTPLDKLLDGGLENDAITNVYGPAGSGKTNIALAAALALCNEGKHVVYVDTEGSFSLERFQQLGGTEKELKMIHMVHVHEWKEQHEEIMKLEKAVEKVKASIVIIDSLVALYRLELDKENFQTVNKQLATQYSVFSKIARQKNVPVLVTNQVYSRGGEIELTSRQIAHYWSKTLVELKKTEGENQRVAVLRKHRSLPEGKTIGFEITKDGLKQIGKFSLF